MISWLALPLLLALSSLSAYAQSSPHLPFRVQVVTGGGELGDSVQSYTKRELRQLPDVEVVDGTPEWIIHVAVLAITQASTVTGYSLSVVVLAPVNELEVYGDKTARYHFLDHWLFAGAPTDLKGHCETLVAFFDSKVLEPRRRTRQVIKDALKESP
jgi:hypothetical protein